MAERRKKKKGERRESILEEREKGALFPQGDRL